MEIKFNLEPEEFCCEYSLANDVLSTLFYINDQKKGDLSSVAVLGDEELMESLLIVFCRKNFDEEIEFMINKLDYNFIDYDGKYAFIATLENAYTRELTISIEKAEYEDGEYKTYDEEDWLYVDECYEDLVESQLESLDVMDIFCITGECEEEIEEDEFDDEDDENEFECNGDCENCHEYDDEFEEDEDEVNLYELVECIVEDVFKKKFSK